MEDRKVKVRNSSSSSRVTRSLSRDSVSSSLTRKRSSSKLQTVNTGNFASYYLELCKSLKTAALTSVRSYLSHKRLDFNGDAFKICDWKPIISALSSDRCLQSIAIRSKLPYIMVFEDLYTENRVIKCGKRPPVFTRFIFKQLMESIRNCLQESKSMTSVELCGLPVQSEYMKIFQEGASKCVSLKNISLSGCRIGDESCGLLCRSLRYCFNVTSLDLSDCGLTCEGAVAIRDLIKNQNIVRSGQRWKDSLRYQIPDLDATYGVKRLTLNNNTGLEDQGIAMICEVLLEDMWMRAVDIQNCGIGNSGAYVILDVLDSNRCLQIVDVRKNPMIHEIVYNNIVDKLAENTKDQKYEFQWLAPRPKSGIPVRKTVSQPEFVTKQTHMTKQRSFLTSAETSSYVQQKTRSISGTPSHRDQTANRNVEDELKGKGTPAVSLRSSSASGALSSSRSRSDAGKQLMITRSGDGTLSIEELHQELNKVLGLLNEEIEAKERLMSENKEIEEKNERLKQELETMKNEVGSGVSFITAKDTSSIIEPEETTQSHASYYENSAESSPTDETSEDARSRSPSNDVNTNMFDCILKDARLCKILMNLIDSEEGITTKNEPPQKATMLESPIRVGNYDPEEYDALSEATEESVQDYSSEYTSKSRPRKSSKARDIFASLIDEDYDV